MDMDNPSSLDLNIYHTAGKESALLNPNVLSLIFELMDLETVKTCRSVCKKWNVVAGSRLRNKTIIVLTRSSELEEFNNTFKKPSDPSMKMIQNFDLCFDDCRKTLGIFLEYRNWIQSLELTAFENYLAGRLLTLPLLESLSIHSMGTNPHIPHWNRKPFAGNTFPKLKSCTLHYSYSHFDKISSESVLENLKDFYISLLQSCEKTLEKLELIRFTRATYKKLFKRVNLPALSELTLDYSDPLYSNSQLPLKRLAPFLRDNCPNLEKFRCRLPQRATGVDVTEILKGLALTRDVTMLAKSTRSSDNASQVTEIPVLTKMTQLTLQRSLVVGLDELASSLPGIRKLSIVLPKKVPQGWVRMSCLEELEIVADDLSLRNYWEMTSENFPNLSKLTMTLCAGSGRLVFGGLLNLKELTVEYGSSLCDQDITGIDAETLLTLAIDSDLVRRSQPYIGNLKSLQVLRLKGTAITEKSVNYGISHLESLKQLMIQYPEVRVTKITYGESPGISGESLDSRILGSPIREVQLRRIDYKSYLLDLEALMLPRVPNLINLSVLSNEEFVKDMRLGPVSILQLEDIKWSRLNFTYTQSLKKLSKQDFGPEFIYVD